MKRIFKKALCAGLCVASMLSHARENVNPGQKTSGSGGASFKTEAADCTTPQAQFDLDINNVRARLLTGGDMWWNFSEARYEVPKGDGTGARLTPIFSGSIWISGLDAGGNLKLAATTYRQRGDDYWPGPITNGTTDRATCNKYDRFFNVYGADIEKAQNAFLLKGAATTIGDIPKAVLAWPGRENPYLLTDPSLVGETFVINDNLAPFKDVDNDGIYNPVKGDYPLIPCRNGEAEAYADQMIFWVINDIGNIHTESGGNAIGVQINCMAFAFQTTDEVNNMTFYKYEIINKSSNVLTQTYVSQNADPDLGCFSDDAIGCDVSRSLGFVYNRNAVDPDCQGIRGYGSQLPLLGIDYFEGPLADNNTELGMSSFVKYTNGGTTDGDPSRPQEYRNYQLGLLRYGVPNLNCQGQPTKYVYDGNPSDVAQCSECSAGTVAGDRRFLQTTGPFTLTPGVSQFVTLGVVFVRPQGGVGLCPNVSVQLGAADDKAQALFNTCFALVSGPDAPTLNIRELDKEVIINLVNETGSNNVGEAYDQVDGVIAQVIASNPVGTNGDSTYSFEGYKLYQIASPTVSATDLDDPAKALLIAQVDVKNGIKRIVNFEKESTLGLFVPVIKADGTDNGVSSSFKITEDLFATGTSKKLVNHRTYYFTAVAYAHNDFKPYDPSSPQSNSQLTAYLQGRKNFKVYSAIPHIPDARNQGTILNSKWGDGVEVLRIEGQGNGGNNLRLTPETIEKILASGNNFSDTLTYVKGFDPIGFKVNDPVSLKEADFELRFITEPDSPINSATRWELKDVTNNVTINSDRSIDRPYEQHIVSPSNEDYGFSLKLGVPSSLYKIPGNYLVTPAGPERPVYGPSTSTIEYQNPVERWLSFVQDNGTTTMSNWIRSGDAIGNPTGVTVVTAEAFDDNWYYTNIGSPPNPAFGNSDVRMTDEFENYEKVINGTWAPYCLTSNYSKKNLTTDEINAGKPPFVYGPGFKWFRYSSYHVPPQNNLDHIASVDVVITPDKSKWTRCVVFETGEDEALTKGAGFAPNAKSPRKGQIRMAPSKMWNDSNSRDFLVDEPSDTGRSWFPGYAVNVETGERLNLFFGESSDLSDQNGADMLWNPTDKEYSPITFPGQLITQLPYFGGKHFIYVSASRYDEGAASQRILLDTYTGIGGTPNFTIPAAVRPVFYDLMWTSIPYLTAGYKFAPDQTGSRYIPPAEIKVKLRVEKPYERLLTMSSGTDSLPRYTFSTKGIGVTEENIEVAKSALDIIRIVPNPYLSYSVYETDQNSTKVKITNLPNTCNITIYSLDGTIIRKLSRAIGGNDPVTGSRIDISDGAPVSEINIDNTVEWDLKNDKSIPIASGVYLFHIEAPGIGSKTLKWFGAVRPADTSNF